MTIEQKIGQFFFPAVFINDTEENIQAMENLIQKYHIGGLTFFHSRESAATNYEAKKKVSWNADSFEKLTNLIERYQKCAPTPLLMCIDSEWGLAMRVENTPQYPYAITLGALPESEIDLVYQVGKQIGLDLKAAGIHYNLAPLADCNNNPKNPVIGYRSFGDDKNKVADFALAYLRGMNDVGILGCLKHFPGHGNTNVDSHLSLPVLNFSLDELYQNELYPFIKGIQNQVDSIMIGHLAVPALNNGKNTSATLSKNVIQKLLREELGYDGLIISDALNMRSVSSLYEEKGELEWIAFDAGNDVLCFTEHIAEGAEKILKNASLDRIEASFNRIWKCKEKVGIVHQNKTIAQEKRAVLDFDACTALNRKIAYQCIVNQKNEHPHFPILKYLENKEVALLSVYPKSESAFNVAIQNQLQIPEFTIQREQPFADKPKVDSFQTLIITLFVPKAKPLNQFDMEPNVLSYLGELFQNKNCILYLFGNPYALEELPHWKKAKEAVLAYQDFDVFQEVAATVFLENLV